MKKALQKLELWAARTLAIIGTIIVIALTINAATAIGENDYGLYYWGFNNTAVDAWNGNTATINAGGSYATVYPSYASSGTGSTHSVATNPANTAAVTLTNPTLGDNFTFSLWFYPGATSDAEFRIIQYQDGTGAADERFVIQESATPNTLRLLLNDGTGLTDSGSVGAFTDASWNHLLLVKYDNGSVQLWVNNSLDYEVDGIAGAIQPAVDAPIGGHPSVSTVSMAGYIDEIKIYNISLSSSQVNQVFQNGTLNLGIPPAPPTANNFTVTVNNSYDFSAVTGITIQIDGQTYTNNTGNKVTTHVLDNATTTYDINISAVGYYNTSKTGYNVSNNLYQSLNQSYITFYAQDIDGNNVSGANFTINGTKKGAGEVFNLKAGTYTVTASHHEYFNATGSVSISSLQNDTLNITGLYDLFITLHIVNTANTTIYNLTTTNVTGDLTRTVNNINGSYNFTLLHGAYNFTSLPQGYSFASVSINTTGNNTPLSFDLYSEHFVFNSVTLYFYDEETYELVDDRTVYIDFIGDDYSVEVNTTTGTTLISALSPVEYIVRYDAEGYYPRSYVFTLVNNTYTLLNLTLLNLSTSENVTFNVYDSLQLPLVGATLKVLKFVTEENSFKLISAQKTNFEGQAQEAMQLNTEYYKFIIEYGGDTVLTTSPTFIFDTTINLYANTLESGFSSLFAITGIYGNITWNNNTHTATYTYTDSENIATSGCVYAYQRRLSGDTLVNSSCLASPAGSINLYIGNTTGTYLLKGYLTKSINTYYLTQRTVSVGQTTVFNTNDNLLLSAIIIITMFFLGFFAIELGIILAGLATMILSFTGLLAVSPGVTVPIFVLSLVIAYMISKGRTGGFA